MVSERVRDAFSHCIKHIVFVEHQVEDLLDPDGLGYHRRDGGLAGTGRAGQHDVLGTGEKCVIVG